MASGIDPIGGLRGVSAGPFQATTLALLIAIGVASFFGATYLQVFDDGSGEPRSNGADVFSRSAIGHRAFAETLRRLGIPVTISRFDTLSKVGDGNLLLVIEPNLDESKGDILENVRDVPHALLVLPKWDGETDPNKPIWIDRMRLLPIKDIDRMLRQVLKSGGGSIDRATGIVTRHSDLLGGKIQLNDPQYFSMSDSTDLTPLIKTDDGVVLGSLRNSRGKFWMLSDPDLLSNSGIDEADNGIVMVAIVEALLPKGGTVIIDETAHGFELRPNLWRAMLHPPFLLVTVSTLIVLVLLVWSGAVRFGAPRPEAPVLADGKLTLVRNAATLLRVGTSAANVLQSYRRLVMADAIAELHGPAGLADDAQAAWLDRVALNRGLTLRLAPIVERIATLSVLRPIDARQALGFAIELHRWKQEILNGTGLHTQRR